MKFLSKKFLWIVFSVAILALAGYLVYRHFYSVLPQSSIENMAEIQIKSSDRVLVFSPHPDDETIATGGAIVKAKNLGAKVEVVLVTDGNRRGLGAERRAEFQKVAEILGLSSSDLVFLNQPEFYLAKKVSAADLSAMLKNQIDNFSPTIIIYPDSSDQNPDHKFIGQTVKNLLPNYQNASGYSYLVHSTFYPRPIGLHEDKFLTPPKRLANGNHNWQKLSLSQSEEDTKFQALSEYKTQLRTPILHELLVAMVRRNELFSRNN
ncbi:MAG: PIG-L family deacetylase [Candidatus Berkelbacteria bacterium]|nr:PIG-L family deacetylase [Candidatus Berkelbacteria bacterium]